MNRLLITCAAAALSAGLLSPVYAQDSSSPTMQPNPQTTPQTAPSSPSTTATAPSDLTGQTIYSSTGRKIGTVKSMTVDAKGQQAAVVSIEKFLGMGGQDVLFPADTLSAKTGGGYATTLTSAQIKKLPKYKGSGMD